MVREGLLIRGARLVLADGVRPGSIHVENGRIAAVLAAGQAEPACRRVLDAGGAYVLPGFIDLHCHGGGGGNAMDGTAESLTTMAETHAAYGTTGFLPTTVTAGPAETMAAVAGMTAWMEAGAAGRGAEPLGIHLEGPYLHPEKAGAQDPQAMRDADVDELRRLWQASGGRIRQVTLAPERAGALEAVRWLAGRGVVVGAAHSTASYEEMLAAAEAGLSHVVHLYNAQQGLHHRRPGVVGAALVEDRFTCEMIADGVHVHPAALRLAVRAKPPGSICLITDAMEAVGQPEGDYRLGGLTVTVRVGEARLADGTLAGSLLTLNRAVANMVRWTGLELHEAAALASTNPARRLGLGDRKGRLAARYDADLVLAGPEPTALDVYLTVRAGRIIYHDDQGPLQGAAFDGTE